MSTAGRNGPAAPVFHGLCLLETERLKASEKRFGARLLSGSSRRPNWPTAVRAPRASSVSPPGSPPRPRSARRCGRPASPLPFRSVAIERDEWGMPYCVLPEPIASEARILVSLSHSRTLAAAYAVLVVAQSHSS